MDKLVATAARQLLVVLLLLASARAQALLPERAISQYGHRVWTTEQGLPQNSVFAIRQTRDGYLWLATQEGLARFDGQRFTVFNTRNTPEIRHNDVWALLEDKSGALWIATRGGGLTCYRDGRFSHYGKAEGLSNDAVQSLYEDRDGTLWVGTRGGGLNHYAGGKFTAYSQKDGLANDTVLAILRDRDGTLWLGTDGGGLSRYRDGRFTTLSSRDGLTGNAVNSLFEDHTGALWIGTVTGLSRWQDGKLNSFHLRDGLSNDNIRSLFEDRDGTLWIGTDGGGLNRYRDGRFSTYNQRQGLSSDSVGAIAEDREGSLWVGTDAGGLNRFKDDKFTSLTAQEGLSNDNARSVFESRDGALWIGTFEGLNRYHDGQHKIYRKSDGLSSEVILSIAETPDGSLWFGTLGGGLNRFADGRFSVYNSKNGLGGDTVLTLLADRSGALWIGTRGGGLNRYAQGQFSHYGTAEGLSSNDVRSLLEAADGSLWIGTLGGGLNHYQDGRFTAYTTKNGLAHDLILSLYQDPDGVIWAGSFGGGLSRIKDGQIHAITSRDGLADDAIFQILDDGAGRLWMSSNHGVQSLSRAELNAFAEGQSKRVQASLYGKADGMKSAECNGAHQPAGVRRRDGSLWFPTIAGVVSVQPAAMHRNLVPPPVLIETVLVDGQPLQAAGAALAPGSRKLEFHYTALSFREPEAVRFQYRLEGFDRDWVDAGSNRTAYYTNIPPGDYRFVVRAANEDGLWNQEGAAISFSQAPYFWQRRTFYFFYLLAALALFGLGARANRARVRWLEAREQELLTLIQERRQAQEELAREAEALAHSNAELEQFTHAIAHDLREPLRGVASYSQLLVRKVLRDDADATEYAGYITEGVQRMHNMMDGLLAYTSLLVEQREVAMVSLDSLLDKALWQLRELIATTAAHITREPLPTLTISGHEISQVFLHLLGNALKFRAEAAPVVQVTAQRDGAYWQISISDNGIGVPKEHSERIFVLFQRLHRRDLYPGSGLGLAICRKIIEREGGRIWVTPGETQGAVFHFTLPAGDGGPAAA